MITDTEELRLTPGALLLSAPAVADLVYEIYGARSITKQVDEMLQFHHDPVWGYEYGLATMNSGYPGLPVYGHGGNTYGAQSEAHYSPVLKASFVVASNVELPYPSPQVSYVNCMATIALIQMMDPDHDHPIRESCKSVGATVKYSPPVPRDVYRDQNLRKASN